MSSEPQVDAGTTRLYALAPDMLAALERISEKAKSYVHPTPGLYVDVAFVRGDRLETIESIVSRILNQVRKGA